jgi:hypothetical protein
MGKEPGLVKFTVDYQPQSHEKRNTSIQEDSKNAQSHNYYLQE